VYDWQGLRLAFASDRASPVPGENVGEIRSATIETDPAMHLHIYTAELDGSGARQVTAGPFQDHRPTFSPDGKWIAFASNRSGETAIWRVRSDGSAAPEPVFIDHWGFRPRYTPEGASLPFYGEEGDRHRIWEVELDTGQISRIQSDDRGMSHGPFMAPNDETILVHSTRGGFWVIWDMPRTDSGSAREITPPGFPMAAHATRARNGVMAFDVKTAS